MAFAAKYPGTCRACGGKVSVGEMIEWSRETGARHAKCKAEASKTAETPPKDAITLYGGSGYGCEGWDKGSVIRSSDKRIAAGGPEWLFVVSARREYVREDGLSFGVGDDQGYLYSATCRAATPEEFAEPARLRTEKIARKDAAKALAGIFDESMSWEYPMVAPSEDSYKPEGDVIPIGEGQTIYGGSHWFVVGSEWIWAIRNNGGDGDNWSSNNVRTGGAGAIGRRTPFQADLAAKILDLAKKAKGT